MPTTTFRTVNGRILGHNKAGVASEYLLDPLGSVIGTSTSAGVVSNRTTYWPYGEVRTGGVSSVTPFGFCGGWGYYTDSSGSLYVRARYYRPSLTRWQTVDPLWPDESAYGYVNGLPVFTNDPSGAKPSGCNFENCFFTNLLTGKQTIFGACMDCVPGSYSDRWAKCNGFPRTYPNKKELALLGWIKQMCDPCNPNKIDASQVCIDYAANFGMIGSIDPDMKAVDCEQACCDAFNGPHDPDTGGFTYKKCLEAFRACIGIKKGVKDIIKGILEGLG
jgi:RHS repeat-associated protein